MDLTLVTYAIPVFFLAIGFELVADRARGRSHYDFNDAINSLSLGILSLIINTLFKGLQLLAFVYLYQNHAFFNLPQTGLLGMLTSLGLWIAVDFCYYWFHRSAHEWRWLWGVHEPHHQSEHFNLSTALRQGALQGSVSWVFYLPLAFLGCSPSQYLAFNAINTLYQFWVHTQHIQRLGFLEKILVTPSHHRVHHGRNPQYINKNFGGFLIVWDKWFGSFREEKEPVIYGSTRSLSNWNPVWANWVPFMSSHGVDKSRADIAQRSTTPLTPYQKYYVLYHFTAIVLGIVVFLLYSGVFSLGAQLAMALILVFCLASIGEILNQNPKQVQWEWWRWGISVVLMVWVAQVDITHTRLFYVMTLMLTEPASRLLFVYYSIRSINSHA